MKLLRSWILAIMFVASTGGVLVTTTTPQSVSAACGDNALLTLPAWYRGIVDEGDCRTIKSPTAFNDTGKQNGLSVFIWKIVLNVIEILLQLIGYLAVAFIIYGGFLFLTSAGSPDGMTKARKTITNAVVGLIISIASVAIVNLIAGSIK